MLYRLHARTVARRMSGRSAGNREASMSASGHSSCGNPIRQDCLILWALLLRFNRHTAVDIPVRAWPENKSARGRPGNHIYHYRQRPWLWGSGSYVQHTTTRFYHRMTRKVYPGLHATRTYTFARVNYESVESSRRQKLAGQGHQGISLPGRTFPH
ncbi:hypothetical protein T440DRAFT_314307 [Plenodomus tracheiphilus IPT5]|uniref:Uncharacterized protein n=1 Tax=Plenodomus tracheiphilus IPT5 TaxID=1408161 RepID=A0A6A7AN57_9PLEO|nr:hypothetical protein T440DRAFT_314307 [Plenodomus tracheiphilus IPT5]